MRRIVRGLYHRVVVAALTPLLVALCRATLTVVFRGFGRSAAVHQLGLERVFQTREAVPAILALTAALTNDRGRMTVAQNLSVFREQIEPVFLKHCAGRVATVLELGPGLLNPFAFPFLFLLSGYCERYVGVDVGRYQWDFAFYGLNVLVDDVVREPLKYRFASRGEAAARLDAILDFDGLRRRDPEAVFRGAVRLFTYDGVAVDRIDPSLRDVDFVWSKDVFEHLERPADLIPRVAQVMKPAGLLYVDVDFKDHDHRQSGKDEWTFLERRSIHSSLNRLRAHEMVDRLLAEHFDIVERTDEIRPIPPGRRARLAEPFRSLSDEQLSITGSIVLCRPRSLAGEVAAWER